jgi:hypothetical protein
LAVCVSALMMKEKVKEKEFKRDGVRGGRG